MAELLGLTRRCAVTVFLFLVPLATSSADLVINVEGVQEKVGNIHVTIFGHETAAQFPDKESVLETIVTPADGDIVSVVFNDLPAGDYAAAALHDANEDGDMNYTFLGLPLEGYGFINGATGFLGPPSFKAAAVTIAPGSEKVIATIPLKYP